MDSAYEKSRNDMILRHRDKGESLASIGRDFNCSGGLIFKIIKFRHVPKRVDILQAMGVDTGGGIVALGPVAPMSQVLESRRCPTCKADFVPNTAKRKQCFFCEPFRKRKK